MTVISILVYMLIQSKNKVADEILSEIKKIGNDPRLLLEKNFNIRLEAIDYLEFHVIDRINALMESRDGSQRLYSLKEYAQKIKVHLEEINNNIFLMFRKKICLGSYKGEILMDFIDEYFDMNVNAFIHHDETGYDNLDIFLNGILTYRIPPAETKNREPEMVYYQKTPARLILELIKRAAFKTNDVFFDLGSGLGQVTILVNLLSSVISKGVEFEPAFCNYAKACANDFYLYGVEFLNTDARYADYSSGTVFYMYTPFEGKILQEVLQNLNGEAKRRKIRIFTYGPVTPEVARQSWLIKEYEIGTSSGEFCEFHSV
jgi:hypothetical protein